MISTLASLPRETLEYTLQVIREDILSMDSSSTQRNELIEAIFSEIMERVGDEEKQLVMRWWNEIAVPSLAANSDQGAGVEKGASDSVSRL